jgi:hypothetical protein
LLRAASDVDRLFRLQLRNDRLRANQTNGLPEEFGTVKESVAKGLEISKTSYLLSDNSLILRLSSQYHSICVDYFFPTNHDVSGSEPKQACQPGSLQ